MLRAGGRVAARPPKLFGTARDRSAGGAVRASSRPICAQISVDSASAKPTPLVEYGGMSFYDKHAATLDRALTAIRERGYWSAFNESPSPRVYGEDAAPRGKAAFEAYLGTDFPLDQPG